MRSFILKLLLVIVGAVFAAAQTVSYDVTVNATSDDVTTIKSALNEGLTSSD